jgi:hypothetical protein
MFFISYRRDDSAGHVGRLYDALAAHFGRQRLFFDIDHIAPGQDFVQVLDDSLNRSSVLLVVIGKRWAGTGKVGSRRIDQSDDFVHLEVAAGLKRPDLRLIPVLIQGARMPSPASLPDDLKDLARRNATELSDTRWKDDVARLIASLEADRQPAASPVDTLRTLAQKVRPPATLPSWAKPAGIAAAALLALGLAVSMLGSGSRAEGTDTAAAGSSEIPRGKTAELPDKIEDGVRKSRPPALKWRSDAQLTAIEARLPDSTAASRAWLVDYTFRSPKDGAGLKVAVSPSGTMGYTELPAVARSAIRPLGDTFLPLPVALDTARAIGMFGPLQSAKLAPATSGARAGKPTWTLRPAQAGQPSLYYVDGLTGARVTAAATTRRKGGILGKVEGILNGK